MPGQRSIHALISQNRPEKPYTSAIITGSFVVEKIFQIPGLGFYFVQSVSTRDYDLLTGLLVVYALFMVAANFLVDMAYGFLDPRIREE